MKALQDRSIAQEGVTSHLCKRSETMTNEQEYYKEALCTFNKEVKKLTEKLKKESAKRQKEQGAKATVEKGLMALLGQVEIAKVDVLTEFKALQPLIDACAAYYGNGFE